MNKKQIGVNMMLFIVGAIYFTRCTSVKYSQQNLSGRFTEITWQGKFGVKDLIFNSDGSFVWKNNKLTNSNSSSFCCDTSTIGKWLVDQKYSMLTLSTTNLPNLPLRLVVKDSSGFNKDSIYFFINNPIERNMGRIHGEIEYNISATSRSDNYSPSFKPIKRVDDQLAENDFNTNKIVVYNPNHERISSFYLFISPKGNFKGENIGIRLITTSTFKVGERPSNVFYIEIPELTRQMINYYRLKDDYIKVVNKNELIWNGVKYVRVN